MCAPPTHTFILKKLVTFMSGAHNPLTNQNNRESGIFLSVLFSKNYNSTRTKHLQNLWSIFGVLII